MSGILGKKGFSIAHAALLVKFLYIMYLPWGPMSRESSRAHKEKIRKSL